jgi:hypothetical protein
MPMEFSPKALLSISCLSDATAPILKQLENLGFRLKVTTINARRETTLEG